MINYNNYNPYENMESWYGVPDYGGAYNSYLGAQQQPLSLGRIVSMVRDLQNSQMRQPIGNQSLNISPPTQAQIPSQIAASIMNTGNRLLSQPRQQLAQSGFNQMPEENLQPNTPADNQMPGGGGGATPGNFRGSYYGGNMPGMPGLPTSAGSAAGHINQQPASGGYSGGNLGGNYTSPSLATPITDGSQRDPFKQPYMPAAGWKAPM